MPCCHKYLLRASLPLPKLSENNAAFVSKCSPRPNPRNQIRHARPSHGHGRARPHLSGGRVSECSVAGCVGVSKRGKSKILKAEKGWNRRRGRGGRHKEWWPSWVGRGAGTYRSRCAGSTLAQAAFWTRCGQSFFAVFAHSLFSRLSVSELPQETSDDSRKPGSKNTNVAYRVFSMKTTHCSPNRLQFSYRSNDLDVEFSSQQLGMTCTEVQTDRASPGSPGQRDDNGKMIELATRASTQKSTSSKARSMTPSARGVIRLVLSTSERGQGSQIDPHKPQASQAGISVPGIPTTTTTRLSAGNARLSTEKEEYKRRQVESEQELGRNVEGLKRLVAVLERRDEEAKGVVIDDRDGRSKGEKTNSYVRWSANPEGRGLRLLWDWACHLLWARCFERRLDDRDDQQGAEGGENIHGGVCRPCQASGCVCAQIQGVREYTEKAHNGLLNQIEGRIIPLTYDCMLSSRRTTSDAKSGNSYARKRDSTAASRTMRELGHNKIGAGEELEGLKSQLVEVQKEFGTYRTEMGEGRACESPKGERERNRTTALDIVVSSPDRHRMAKEQYSVQAHDMDELLERHDIVCDKSTRTDVEFPKATEELSVLEGEMEIMRNECRELEAKEHQSRLDKQLQGNEEKLAIHERRGSIASLSVMAGDGVVHQAPVDDATTKEHASLKVAEVDLEDVRKHWRGSRSSVRQARLVGFQRYPSQSFKTTGITETTFKAGELTYKQFNVGGQWSRRKKWNYCFENVTALVFLVSLSEYDQILFSFLFTRFRSNRMQEALILFDSILTSRWFVKIKIILFLNIVDMVAEKLPRSPLGDDFPDYTGLH
ncbi:G-alpha-domain-containing protein [Stereum hirsutum FP-91666 SS1]|uniref:G-alpha-domain-containing protein n=1 Tax=Stereum hirsutum (strain FP-91666) TaxID=721885 RepID=UPI0004449275|nr:G-alpha-domain-containing protein [Stereum hirsutum FP-91666 SS1]EIM83658.1 G-alpha-domain-containing protein [Stereum hirsutum FP-91666 SS1]